MPKVVHRFKTDFFDSGRVKYARGKSYEPNEETTGAVRQGHAEEVTPEKAEADEKAAEKAAATKDKKGEKPDEK